MANRRSRYKDMNIEMNCDKVTDEEDKVEFPTEMETNGPKTKNGIIQGATFVRFRDRPSFEESNVVELLPADTKVVILGNGKEFYKVKTSDGREGYVALPFLREE